MLLPYLSSSCARVTMEASISKSDSDNETVEEHVTDQTDFNLRQFDLVKTVGTGEQECMRLKDIEPKII